MGVPDSSLLDLIQKVKSWILRATVNPTFSGGFVMDSNRTCCECKMNFTGSSLKYQCQSCNRVFCGDCVHGDLSFGVVASGVMGSTKEAEIHIKSCKFCTDFSTWRRSNRKYCDKIHPSELPRQCLEPPSPNSNDRIDIYSFSAATKSSFTSFSSHPSPSSFHRSPSRSDEDEGDDLASHFLSPLSDCCHDTSDIDSSSVSAVHEFYSSKSVGSSPSVSPSRIHFNSRIVGCSVQQKQLETFMSHNHGTLDQETLNILSRLEKGVGDLEIADDGHNLSGTQNQSEREHKLLDFENNSLIWFPPPPENENDETENNYFIYDDEDDEIGESGATFSMSGNLGSMFPLKEKQNLDHQVLSHFKALVSQLLQAEGIRSENEGSAEKWLDIVTSIAWQAANIVKPDTSRGGSMDPGDYVKVKCVASGRPCDSTLIKGIVCTKNIKHKRMTSQYKNARILLLGGALEYQRAPNQLASFNTLLQQERDHLGRIVSKIEGHHPNVLLVEKSVSSYAQELLLAKEISLVLNVKRPVLERIARCTGASVTPSVDNISTTRLGHCELFRLEKVAEEHEPTNKKPSKTLMFFDGCPRRLGCTVLLKGLPIEVLKKVKRVVQYAVFAAYHLSLETSFLADEGATLPKMTVARSISIPERKPVNNAIAMNPSSIAPTSYLKGTNCGSPNINMENGVLESLSQHQIGEYLSSPVEVHGSLETDCNEGGEPGEPSELSTVERFNIEGSDEYNSAADIHQSILVSFSSRCVLNDTVCERSRLLRFKFYSPFDKPLGKYLQDDVLSETSTCQSCKEPAEAHVICYTHQHGNLTINVRRIPSVKLPGERDRKIWMWHRCLECAQVDGVPPATRRVLLSDAAWGLSFGKFLELSFSDHKTANRIATCGHSLQRDCLRYYGCGSMIACFRYSPIDILSVRLPPSVLEFNSQSEQAWIMKEVAELLRKAKSLYAEISSAVQKFEEKSASVVCDWNNMYGLHNCILELKDMLMKEKNYWNDLHQPTHEETSEEGQTIIDVLELNRLRHSLLTDLHVWDHRLYYMESLFNNFFSSQHPEIAVSCINPGEWGGETIFKDGSLEHAYEENVHEFSNSEECPGKALHSEHDEPPVPQDALSYQQGSLLTSFNGDKTLETQLGLDNAVNKSSLERAPSAGSILSDKIDCAWTGIDPSSQDMQVHASLQEGERRVASFRQLSHIDSPTCKRLRSPARVYSFDSALRVEERISKRMPPSPSYLSTLKSFHAYGDYRNMIRDPVSNIQICSQALPREAQKLNLLPSSSTTFTSHASILPEGARLMVPENGQKDVVIAVYDNEPTSIISYALSSKEYKDWVTDKPYMSEGGWGVSDTNKESPIASKLSTWQRFGSLDLDYMHFGSYGSEDASGRTGFLFSDPKLSPHPRISFEDGSSNTGGKVKFSVTCYFAKQFDDLRKKCCPSELDFIRSLSRCKRWSAQGGKSNVYFAKSLDERFIIKQIQKTELDSFEEFAPKYFKYLTDSHSSRSPTCLAKVVGIYQVAVKHLKGGKETKMDLIVMENLFYGRSISRVYDLKGSVRSRYNSDTKANKVLLDLNFLESLQTKPIFLGSKAKRSLERAVWNDTSFLAGVYVMDYSLLVGVDEERKELVLGIIDFMRQYTWDKHLETWVKASGILGGPKNASPTVISPIQYKKRFRKAMTSYFLTVPDQWSP
ncbi:putative 1-phosphatidylinositol-3-phosphate 5-kinase FAB1C [Ipomoea triloba]|uniref:putative 1-phosphatidylinositol-3-phosphate 5-kinase FAB1C n=1 Tax=Ipomoea triloba TaxID=35885 RepID=UPI00125CDFE7|nr:putative 1-phosphatidylinositol-3-phosphate 5-kinase FAB1C [Ipomoea triloba]